jgi:hypothetical protein
MNEVTDEEPVSYSFDVEDAVKKGIITQATKTRVESKGHAYASQFFDDFFRDYELREESSSLKWHAWLYPVGIFMSIFGTGYQFQSNEPEPWISIVSFHIVLFALIGVVCTILNTRKYFLSGELLKQNPGIGYQKGEMGLGGLRIAAYLGYPIMLLIMAWYKLDIKSWRENFTSFAEIPLRFAGYALGWVAGGLLILYVGIALQKLYRLIRKSS